MDFRKVDVAGLVWTPPRKSGLRAAKSAGAKLPTGGRLAVQTPRFACRVYEEGAKRTLLLTLSESQLHRDFVQFVADLEDGAMQAGVEWNDEHSDILAVPPVPSLRDGRMRLAVFTDALWFDSEGKHTPLYDESAIPIPIVMEGCACVIEFGGVWMGSGPHPAWGLRWRVIQVRGCDPPRPTFGFIDDPVIDPASVQKYVPPPQPAYAFI